MDKLNLYDQEVKSMIDRLSNIIRAEFIESNSFIDLYVGDDIRKINNISNQIIYGRRGSGKTHLLKALQEFIVVDYDNSKRMPIYIDLRTLLPLVSASDTDPVQYAIIIFRYIIQEILDTILLQENLQFLYKKNEWEDKDFILSKQYALKHILNDLN